MFKVPSSFLRGALHVGQQTSTRRYASSSSLTCSAARGVFRVRMARPRGNERAARRKAPIRGGMWRNAGSPPFSMVRATLALRQEHSLPHWDGVFRTSARRWSMGSTVDGGAGRKGNGIRRNTAREPPPRIPEGRSRTPRTFWATCADLAASRGPLAKSPHFFLSQTAQGTLRLAHAHAARGAALPDTLLPRMRPYYMDLAPQPCST